MNFFVEYCNAPAAITNGTIGIGGGNKAGTAIAPNPYFSNVSVTIFAFRADSRACIALSPCFLAIRYVMYAPTTEPIVAIPA